MKHGLISAMYDIYAAQYEVHRTQIDIYVKNLTGVGEHIDFKGPIEAELKKMAELKDLMDAIESL
jgi:hypothetical protein